VFHKKIVSYFAAYLPAEALLSGQVNFNMLLANKKIVLMGSIHPAI